MTDTRIIRGGTSGPPGPPGDPGGPQGEPGADGAPGDDGAPGANGWSPVLATVTDGARRVLRVTDWTGGTGAEPAANLYLGAAGLTSVIGDAVDVRGAAGTAGAAGANAPVGEAAGCRITRVSSTPLGAATGLRDVTDYDTLSRADPGFAYDLIAGTITVTDAGWYACSAAVRFNTGTASGNYNQVSIGEKTTPLTIARGAQPLGTIADLDATGVRYLPAGGVVYASAYTAASQAIGGSGGFYLSVVKLVVGAAGASVPGAFTFDVPGALTVGAGVRRIYNDTGRTLTISKVRASVGTAPTGATLLVDVNLGGTTIFTTQAARPAVAIGANTAVGTPAVTAWPDGTYLTVDVDQVGSSVAGSNLTVQVTAA